MPATKPTCRASRYALVLLAAAVPAQVHANGGTATARPPVATPQPPAAPVTRDWSGFYVGAHLGASVSETDQSDLNNQFLNEPPTQSEVGVSGGLYLGYNYTLPDGLVLGAEFDYSTGVEMDNFFSANAAGTSGQVYDNSFESIMSLRARAGLPRGNSLIYITGGVAYGDGTFEAYNVNRPVQTTCDNSICAETSDGFFGLAIGAGVEHAFRENVVGRFEVMHYEFESQQADVEDKASGGIPACSTGATDSCTFGFSPSVTQVRVGISYNF
ncbi:outer membrane protein [Roseovarius tibetensis]|uniref:outer membrane protein n=1 Tax=Roseovarius tibetensis TaxID=2685897 RepID=UPI003D7F396D